MKKHLFKGKIEELLIKAFFMGKNKGNVRDFEKWLKEVLEFVK